MQTIFITGASSGLGKATAKLFQSKGWKVIASMRAPERETELNLLENVVLTRLDVTDAANVESTISKTLETEHIDVVFNNAGYGLTGALENLTNQQIEDQIGTNLTGVLRVAKEFIPYFRQKRGGMFITTTSIFGIVGGPLASVYNATKWALEGWSESMAYELAQFNIQVKTVAPGGIKSDFVKNMKAAENPEYQSISERMNQMFADGTYITFTDVELIADVVFKAATDGKDQMRYIAGEDACRIDTERREMGYEGYGRFFKDKFLLTGSDSLEE